MRVLVYHLERLAAVACLEKLVFVFKDIAQHQAVQFGVVHDKDLRQIRHQTLSALIRRVIIVLSCAYAIAVSFEMMPC